MVQTEAGHEQYSRVVALTPAGTGTKYFFGKVIGLSIAEAVSMLEPAMGKAEIKQAREGSREYAYHVASGRTRTTVTIREGYSEIDRCYCLYVASEEYRGEGIGKNPAAKLARNAVGAMLHALRKPHEQVAEHKSAPKMAAGLIRPETQPESQRQGCQLARI